MQLFRDNSKEAVIDRVPEEGKDFVREDGTISACMVYAGVESQDLDTEIAVALLEESRLQTPFYERMFDALLFPETDDY